MLMAPVVEKVALPDVLEPVAKASMLLLLSRVMSPKPLTAIVPPVPFWVEAEILLLLRDRVCQSRMLMLPSAPVTVSERMRLLLSRRIWGADIVRLLALPVPVLLTESWELFRLMAPVVEKIALPDVPEPVARASMLLLFSRFRLPKPLTVTVPP